MTHGVDYPVRLTFRYPSADATSAWDVYNHEIDEHLGYVESRPLFEHRQRQELGGTTWRQVQIGKSWQAYFPDGTLVSSSPESHRLGAIFDLVSAIERSTQ